ncbi:MAG: 50S ribosomal protein L11 methyltransferase [Pseudolabrys sp.]
MQPTATPWWQVFVETIEKLPLAQQADRFVSLANEIRSRGERNSATALALRAWRLARECGIPQDRTKILQALAAGAPGYHVQISTDPQRIATWQMALADILRPGMLVLEVGTGSGILAMLAAQAGANVVTCEKNLVLAAIAEETVRANGLAGRVTVVGKAVEQMRIPQDLPRPADLLMLDMFSDDLFSFKPFDAIRAAKPLLRPGATVMPMQVSLQAALADFARWPRMVPDHIAGLDISPLADIAGLRHIFDSSDPDFQLRSAPMSMVSAVLPDDLPSQPGAPERTAVSDGGPVNGVANWLRMELAPGHVLEARPGVAPRGFYAKPRFYAFREAVETKPGQQLRIRFAWDAPASRLQLIEPSAAG